MAADSKMLKYLKFPYLMEYSSECPASLRLALLRACKRKKVASALEQGVVRCS